MTWSRKDILADIARLKLDLDVTLPYSELKKAYCQARYTRRYIASGSFSFAKDNSPPIDTKQVASEGRTERG